MVFSGITFLYYFLPIMLFIYFISKTKYKNIILLIGSLLFYFYGEPKYIIILLLSGIINYFIGKKLVSKNKKIYLILGLTLNLGLLFYFKYFNFLLENINNIFNSNINYINVIIPLGISFYTFKNISYLIDVYNKKVKPSNNLLNYLVYISLFFCTLEGPIVRYETIEKQLVNRTSTKEMISKGITRFIIGLSKKVLIANVLGGLVNSLTLLETKSVVSYWLKAITDILRLYIDFSGYSDMAIGLGLIFGFTILENFDYPFTSKTMTEFWRKWHISLSSFFKDYVYIPLGGSRVNKLKRLFNIMIVWSLTGLWHGASYNFIIWGLYFGIILLIEKKFFYNLFSKHKFIGTLLTNILVIIGFVFFYNEGLKDALISLKSMFGLNNIDFINLETIYYIKNYIVVLVLGYLISLKVFNKIINKLKNNKIINLMEPLLLIFLLLVSTAFIIDESFNPFLYFRF